MWEAVLSSLPVRVFRDVSQRTSVCITDVISRGYFGLRPVYGCHTDDRQTIRIRTVAYFIPGDASATLG